MTLFVVGLVLLAIICRLIVVKSKRRSHIMVDLLAARTYHARLWMIRARLKGLHDTMEVRP